MKTLLRALSARFPRAARQWHYARHNLRDVYDTYLARPLPPQPTPLGFRFGGLASQHHAAMQKATFEPAEVALLQQVLPAIDVFVDVGANVGYFTCLARSLGRTAVALEPMPRNLAALFRNLQANGWSDTEVQPLAASDRPGIQTLYGASSTGASLIDNWAGAPSAFRRTICVSTLDNILAARFEDKRLFVKIDVEGHEHQALLGARAILSRRLRPIWLVEITFHEYHPQGRNPHFAESFDLFFSRAYKAFLLKEAGQDLQPVTAADVARWTVQARTDLPYVNYLFVPDDVALAGVLPRHA